MATEWHMPRPGQVCAGCARGFEPDETFRALLFETPSGYERRDYCAGCTPPERPAPIGTWRTRRPAPVTKKVQPFDREAIYSFFLRLEDPDRPEQVQFRFVLAVLLWRKKFLKFERSLAVEGCECWEFSTRGSPDTHRVERPDLAEDQLERLGQQLEQLLAGEPGDLDTPTAAPAAQEQADD